MPEGNTALGNTTGVLRGAPLLLRPPLEFPRKQEVENAAHGAFRASAVVRGQHTVGTPWKGPCRLSASGAFARWTLWNEQGAPPLVGEAPSAECAIEGRASSSRASPVGLAGSCFPFAVEAGEEDSLLRSPSLTPVLARL
ncbi:hypothetical protein cyc_01207 [Cyclospora cayetanensis]|uniref:Uncharacterized protein n=1 Tax=Cyclospora cayetanensis TaxID=88456 RepID=A0A1D3CXN3_9EIME|nr:hypothetical protein cyc_01207 [Cyclospora cayetanensis]